MIKIKRQVSQLDKVSKIKIQMYRLYKCIVYNMRKEFLILRLLYFEIRTLFIFSLL